MTHRRYLALLAALFLLVGIVSGWSPWYRSNWWLENALVVAFAILVAVYHRRMLFSRLSYTLIFLLLCLHEIGAHYTYSEVPYEDWTRVLGFSLNEVLGWQRNNFDRVVHFAYGLLLAYPVREVFIRIAQARGFWSYFLPLDLTMSTSMLYELIEWAAAERFGGELGMAYLGTQGDVWDAHKDMALASAGALITMCTTALINLRYQRDFGREWTESLRVNKKNLSAKSVSGRS